MKMYGAKLHHHRIVARPHCPQLRLSRQHRSNQFAQLQHHPWQRQHKHQYDPKRDFFLASLCHDALQQHWNT